ncbi:MAG: hypothetical protein IPP78_14490 [Holophagaceae bacterium]|nr:hypothetical protein [Holophagaceae bacterium]
MDSIMDQRILTRFRRISGALGIFVAALGALVLFGWALNIHVVKDAVPSIGTTMKPNTALGFILSGVALNLLTRTRLPWTRYANLALALGVISIGAFTLLEYATGWNLHIDELLFREHLNALETLPGRMSTVTASTFVLAGMALFFIEDEQRPGFRFAQFSGRVDRSRRFPGLHGLSLWCRRFVRGKEPRTNRAPYGHCFRRAFQWPALRPARRRLDESGVQLHRRRGTLPPHGAGNLSGSPAAWMADARR